MKTSRQPPSQSVTDIALARRRFALMAAEETARIAARIKERHSELGLTQGELAAKLPGKTDAQQVSKWERAVHRPEQAMEHLAAALEVDLSYFYAPEPQEGTPDLMGALSREPATAQSELEAIRAEVAGVREDLAQITDLLTQLLDPLAGLLSAQEEVAQHTAEPAPKRAAPKQRQGGRRKAS